MASGWPEGFSECCVTLVLFLFTWLQSHSTPQYYCVAPSLNSQSVLAASSSKTLICFHRVWLHRSTVLYGGESPTKLESIWDVTEGLLCKLLWCLCAPESVSSFFWINCWCLSKTLSMFACQLSYFDFFFSYWKQTWSESPVYVRLQLNLTLKSLNFLNMSCLKNESCCCPKKMLLFPVKR